MLNEILVGDLPTAKNMSAKLYYSIQFYQNVVVCRQSEVRMNLADKT